ncbi:MAG TPA: thymidine phosphorylase [Vicinamibacterales bacterium]|nr:thymidine phosphorylase [Vicinamibacterales bacterium]HPK70710.1 thymidine phosphorylase [Vicinamibacterales bacterium]
MHAVEIIRKKRDGLALERDDVARFVSGATDGSWPDYQLSAMLMATVLRGMTDEETAWLTEAMAQSGARFDLGRLAGRKVDKHSTGGVGDKTSLILAPLAAACGVVVPMMSGRGLGHTGGTLDKLESIPGFRVDLGAREIVDILEDVGCVIVGQTEDIAPADRRLYRLRDVTATVESIPLITASIMSKKLAEGIDALVLDVKVGSGAFMRTLDDAERLARSMVRAGALAGVRTEALLTRMDAPLGRAVGNSIEVVESIQTLRGQGPRDVTELSLLLAARMVLLAGRAASAGDADRRVREALASGAGFERFRRMIERQGGDPEVADEPERLLLAPGREIVRAPRAGYLTGLDALLVGRAAAALGAGRATAEARVDHGVGIRVIATLGALLRAGDPVLELIHRDGNGLADAADLARQAIELGGAPPAPRPLVVGDIV